MLDCWLNCHGRCRELAPKRCTKYIKYKAMSSKDLTGQDWEGNFDDAETLAIRK